MHEDGDHHCDHLGSPIEKLNIGEFTKKQIEAFNNLVVREEIVKIQKQADGC